MSEACPSFTRPVLTEIGISYVTPVLVSKLRMETPRAGLARGGLAVAYKLESAHAVDPVIAGVRLSADKRSLTISVGGLGTQGLKATLGADGFEVLGDCDPQPAVGTCTGATTCLCWASTPIAAASSQGSVTVTGLPASPQAVRYLWYISPYALDNRLLRPFVAPVYAVAEPIPNAAPIPGGADTLPLGPFVLPLGHHAAT